MNFIWSRGRSIEHAHGGLDTLSRNLGRLGIRRASLANIALLGKLVWDFLHAGHNCGFIFWRVVIFMCLTSLPLVRKKGPIFGMLCLRSGAFYLLVSLGESEMVAYLFGLMIGLVMATFACRLPISIFLIPRFMLRTCFLVAYVLHRCGGGYPFDLQIAGLKWRLSFIVYRIVEELCKSGTHSILTLFRLLQLPRFLLGLTFFLVIELLRRRE